MANLKITILSILLTVSCMAQNKAIVPQSGTIVFSCKMDITDLVLFNQSKKDFKKEFLKDMKETLIIERRFAGIPVDTLKVSQFIKSNEVAFSQLFDSSTMDDDNVKFCLQYQDTMVKKYKIKNDFEEEVLNINAKTRMFEHDFTEQLFDYSENNIKEVKEYRKSTKKINGYKCFKIIYTFSEPDLSEYSSLMSSYTNTREMWVTDKIKSDFHPIINDREIIMQYYPLEILEYSDMVKGVKKIYKLESINIPKI
ncbi:hypothetical protein [Flavobacterium sp.]|uniref:hypothetical protein n=1 Tax=Flavobacterium sp. TaxID=239 RepID=UPI003D6B2C99